MGSTNPCGNGSLHSLIYSSQLPTATSRATVATIENVSDTIDVEIIEGDILKFLLQICQPGGLSNLGFHLWSP